MLALITGHGDLPARIAAAQPDRPLICAVQGYLPVGLEPDLTFRLETIGTLLATLKARGVTDVCLCGAVDRPQLDPAALDAATAPLVPFLMQAIGQGDDGALRAALALFEREGFVVRAAQDLLADLFTPPGVLTQAAPDTQMRADAARGSAVLAALGPLDVGQGCVVAQGQVLGVEAIGGTDFMLASLPPKASRAGGILVKGPKIGQDGRVDMPTIGPATVDALQAAGLSGLVIEAGAVIVLEREQVVAKADAAGLVLWSREPD